jgi:hypothetical protein
MENPNDPAFWSEERRERQRRELEEHKSSEDDNLRCHLIIISILIPLSIIATTAKLYFDAKET